MNIKFLSGLFAVIFAANVYAQEQNQQITMPDVKERPTAQANYIETDPVIDGNILDDEVWKQITPITQLVQTRPQSGSPVSEKTEVRIAYTDKTFYISAVCYDTNPGSLVVSDMRRDGSLDNIDAFLFILDTYHDNQNGFIFGTNSQGIEYDAQVDNEGQGNNNVNRQQGGVIGGFNLNWDAAWVVKTQVGDYGWSAEFAIPLKTLRFQPGEDKTWGLNFQRNITKTNEVAFWAPLPIEFDLKRLSLEGTLTGLNLKNPGNLKVIPYVLGRHNTDGSVEPSESSVEGDVGVDVKYSITPNVTLDLTYNTDFAQVEVDEQQVNLNRFNLFFPEKRPFFLENAGLFSVGSPGEVDLFFSRKIGIAQNDIGQAVQVPILGGARLSGRINQTNIGFLNMFTDDRVTGSEQINNYSAVRVNHQVASRSTIGAAFVNKTDIKSDTSYNRIFAMDGKIGLGKKAQIVSYIAKSVTPGVSSQDFSYRLQTKYEWNGWQLNADLNEVAPEFNPEVGFLGREAFRKYEFLVWKRLRSENWNKMLELRPHVSYRGYFDSNTSILSGSFHQTGFLHVDNHWVWKSGFEVHTGVNFTKEGLTEDFKLDSTEVRELIVPKGTYDHAETQLVFMTNPSKMFYLSTRHQIGGYFGGQRQLHSGTFGFRYGDNFKSEVKTGISWFDLPGGTLFTEIYGWRMSYSITPRINLQSLIQYNSKLGLWSTNLRFSVLQAANSGLFVVFNQLNLDGSMYNRTLTLKYTYLFDVIR